MKKKLLKKRIKELEEDIRCFRSSVFTDRLRVEIKYDMIERTGKSIWSEYIYKENSFDGLLPLISVYENTNEEV